MVEVLIIVLLAGAVVALAAIVFGLRRQITRSRATNRSRMDVSLPAARGRHVGDERSGEQGSVGAAAVVGVAREPKPEAVLVNRISDELAVVFGPEDVLRPFGEVVDQFTPQIARGIAFGNATVQGLVALDAVSGRLVRLTAESAAALKEFGAVKDSAGAVLGVVKGSGGKFAQMLRFESAAGAQAATALATVGPALTAIALQMQLQQISNKLDRIDRRTQRVEQHLNDELITSIRSDIDQVDTMGRIFELTGQINETDWSSFAQHLKSIRQNRYRVKEKFTKAIDELRTVVPEGDNPDPTTRFDRLRKVGLESRPDLWAQAYFDSAAALLLAERIELQRRLTANDVHLAEHVQLARQRITADFTDVKVVYDSYRSAIETVQAGSMSAGIWAWRDREVLRIAIDGMVGELRHQVTPISKQLDAASRDLVTLQIEPGATID